MTKSDFNSDKSSDCCWSSVMLLYMQLLLMLSFRCTFWSLCSYSIHGEIRRVFFPARWYHRRERGLFVYDGPWVIWASMNWLQRVLCLSTGHHTHSVRPRITEQRQEMPMQPVKGATQRNLLRTCSRSMRECSSSREPLELIWGCFRSHLTVRTATFTDD